MLPEQVDHVVAALARTVPDGAFVGVGLGTPTALVAAMLATQRRGGHVLAGGGLDVEPPIDRWLAGSDAAVGYTGGFVPHFVSMDWAESQLMTMQFLRPAQVDGAGNLNTSRLGSVASPGRRFPGGLATGDVPRLLSKVVVYLPRHLPRATPRNVGFVTGAGSPSDVAGFRSGGVSSLVTDLGVVEWTRAGPKLAGVHPWATIEDVVERTGFDLDASAAAPTTRPTEREMHTLEVVDPNRVRDLEWTAE